MGEREREDGGRGNRKGGCEGDTEREREEVQ